MPGTTKSYNSAMTARGPADLWLKLAVPAAAGTITLHTDGTPESVANPTAQHVGMLKTGSEVEINAEIQERTSDNLSTPYAVALLTSKATIKGDMLQVLDTLLIATISLGGTRITATGKEIIQFGSLSAVAYSSVAAIWALAEDATKFAVVNLYRAYNASGWKATLNRNEDGTNGLELTGTAITSRATEDQVCQIYKQVP
jgi:hypothetical protein